MGSTSRGVSSAKPPPSPNEAIGTPKPGDWKASLAKGEGWYASLEWRWVELAFARAAKVVDSHPEWSCKLIYNDFGLDSPDKARAVYEMVKDVNERYAAARPQGKPMIEVIGMQGHYNLATKASDVEASIKLFATLGGVKVHVTEIKLDASQAADGLIGNIAVRGGGGGNAYTVNWIKVQRIGTGGAADRLLAEWPKK